MNAAVKLPPMLTVADFLDWSGDGTNTRYELVDGVLRAMAPAADTHNTILLTLGSLIRNHLERQRPNCRVVATPGVQPRVRAEWNFRIPDLGVTCTPTRPGEIMTPDPIILVEILSPGNANDTYENVRAFTTLPSVMEILIVHSTRIEVERLMRDTNSDWPANAETISVGGILRLASIGGEWPIEAVYSDTHLGKGLSP